MQVLLSVKCLNVNLRLFGEFPIVPIFDNLVSQKRLVVDQRGPKVGPQGNVLSIYRVLLTVKCSESVCRYIFDFSDFRQPCI